MTANPVNIINNPIVSGMKSSTWRLPSTKPSFKQANRQSRPTLAQPWPEIGTTARNEPKGSR